MNRTPPEPSPSDQENRFEDVLKVGKLLIQSGTIGDIHYHYPKSKWLPPQQLPPSRRHWVDRPHELAELEKLTAPDRAVVVISGPRGVGKTALALRWAYDHLERFPDGQLYADLGECPDTGPASPSDILRGWLPALGDTRDELPEELAALVSNFRTWTAERRLLVLLDDAISAAQVRCLLSASPQCVTLVTTPYRLGGLAMDASGFMRVELPHAEAKRTDEVEG